MSFLYGFCLISNFLKFNVKDTSKKNQVHHSKWGKKNSATRNNVKSTLQILLQKKVLVKSLFNLILDFMVNLLRKFLTPYPLHKNIYNFGKGKTTIT